MARADVMNRPVFAWFRALKRRRLVRRPFPDAWRSPLDALPFYSLLPGETQERFRDLLKVFIWSKQWEGAGGFELRDEHKVVIGATAVRLVVGLDLSYYDKIKSIVVYPNTYSHPDSHGRVLGQVSRLGALVLSWTAVKSGIRSPDDGRDTTIHEFAHALDLADGVFDGLPPQREMQHVRPWCDVMQTHYDGMQDRRPSRRHVLREYGATNPAEFFAVASEVFFEQPGLLKAKKSDLYGVMRAFYGFDPIVKTADSRRPSRVERNRRKRRRRAQD